MIRIVMPQKPPIVRLARRLAFLFSYGLTFLAGVALGLLLVGYQARVAVEQMTKWGARLVLLEEDYQRHHAAAHNTTKAQAQVIVHRKLSGQSDQ